MKNNGIRRIPNPVPKMVDPLGTAWSQPDPNNFQFFQRVNGGKMFVNLSENDKSELKVYESSIPSGVYHGKMWRCEGELRWYGVDPDPKFCSNGTAKIIT